MIKVEGFFKDVFELYLGDCLEIVPLLGKTDVAIITDPPYGINHSTSHGASWANTKIKGDTDTRVRDIALKDYTNVAAFGTWKTPPIENTKGVAVWDKGPAFGMGDLSFPWKNSFELIYIRGNLWRGYRDEGVLRGSVVVSWESKGRVHPHEKPVWLMEHFIRKLPDDIVILDPFMGGGTTGVACMNLGRKFIGIEIEPKYFNIACERIQRAWENRPRLFEEEKPKVKQLEIANG